MKQQILKVPDHIGFIMDGNGRWAKQRGLVRSMGHNAGKKTLDLVVKECFYKYGIKSVSVYAFSTENWNRPQAEIDYLIKIFRHYLNKDLQKKYPDVRLNVMGDHTKFPEDISKKVVEIMEETKHITAHTLNFCVNYSGKQEITRAINLMLDANLKNVTEQDIDKYLYTNGQPPLDLIVRTGGEQRLSNFMLWQAAYAELYFCKTLWPDFKKKDIKQALLEYQSRDRRFGAIEK